MKKQQQPCCCDQRSSDKYSNLLKSTTTATIFIKTPALSAQGGWDLQSSGGFVVLQEVHHGSWSPVVNGSGFQSPVVNLKPGTVGFVVQTQAGFVVLQLGQRGVTGCVHGTSSAYPTFTLNINKFIQRHFSILNYCIIF